MLRKYAMLIGITAFLSLLLLAAPSSAQVDQSGFRAINGAEAAAFLLPNDVELVTIFDTAYGLTYERYQQKFGEAGADVLGGQLTLYRASDGQISHLFGAYYPAIVASNNVNLTAAQARALSARDIGLAGNRQVDLRINPATGRYFYQVETRRIDSRWIHWINADSGRVVNKFNALAHICEEADAPCGHGVQFTEPDNNNTDVKDLTGLINSPASGPHELVSARVETHDQGSSRRPFKGPIAVDADNLWIDEGDESPAQQALVDAHFYANLADDYYQTVYGYDLISFLGAKLEVQAHFQKDYNNAYWNGFLALGDGDQVSFAELTSLDVVGHEFTHGVTEYTSNLIYQDESGALNEAFSDMMGSSMEYYAAANLLEPATNLKADWLIGEDFDLRPSTNPGFRNMGDPGEDGDPSHYADRYTGSEDNGGVHSNSGIANHWYYLLVNGGQNSDSNRASGSNVVGITLAPAEQIAFLSFAVLTENATFCDARLSTLNVAGIHSASVAAAWDEVGVDSVLCDGGSPNNSPTADFSASATALTVSFTDTSSDTDGTIASWLWDFGDGSPTATAQDPSHTYAAAGSYTVSLTVTDNEGAADSTSASVSVSDGSTGISLAVNGYKDKGLQKAELTWSGAASASVDIWRDGSLLINSTANDGTEIDPINARGGGTYTYRVCEAGATRVCSAYVTIGF